MSRRALRSIGCEYRSQVHCSTDVRQLIITAVQEHKAMQCNGRWNRRDLYKALKLIENQVFSAIGDKQVLIKPNFVQTSKQLAGSHADAIRGILEFLRPKYQ